MTDKPTTEPAAGTLSTALSLIDADMADAARSSPARKDSAIAAAWATVRAAAIASLEPAATPPPNLESAAAAVVRQFKSEVSGLEPSSDSAIQIAVVALAAFVELGALGVGVGVRLVTAVDRVASRISEADTYLRVNAIKVAVAK